MSMSLNRKTSSDKTEVNNYITIREIPCSPIPISYIFKDSLSEDKLELSSVNILNKLNEKKNKYCRRSSKHIIHKNKNRNKKKKVRFKHDFIDEVVIESYKEHNLKMCFMQVIMEEPNLNKKKNCKECIEKYCVIM